MMEILLSLLVADWIMKDMSPATARCLLITGAIIAVIVLAIASGSVVCIIALAIVAGIVGLSIFQKNHTI